MSCSTNTSSARHLWEPQRGLWAAEQHPAHTGVHFCPGQPCKDVLSLTLRLQCDLRVILSREAFWITPQEISAGFVLFSERHKPDVLHSKWLSGFCFCCTGSFITSCQPGERDTGKERRVWQKWKCEKNNWKSFTKSEIWKRLRRKCTARLKKTLGCTSHGKRFYKTAKRR